MSFFGFDTTLPRGRGHQANAPGFGQPHDAFAGLSGRGLGDDDALEFEETYDGLADQLDETDDAFNDDTFGAGPATQQSIGRDFDFSGQTAKVAGTLQEEQMLYAARQPPRKASPPKQAAKPARTGYESYAQPGYIPQLEANASLWGMAPKKPTSDPVTHQRQESQGASAGPSRKMMSLEEVEAAMRAQGRKPTTPQPAEPAIQPSAPPVYQPQLPHTMPVSQSFSAPSQILQRPQRQGEQTPNAPRQPVQPELPAPGQQHPQILQRPRQQQTVEPTAQRPIPTQPAAHRASPQPRQILQNPNRLSGQGQPMAQLPPRQPEMPRIPPVGPPHSRGPSYNGPVVTHPQQLLQLSEEERAAFLLEDAKRAKRNHKIHLLSKDNGLMTPQDKNFITRIQLQQLVTATGNVDEQGPEAALAEDFYYQVFSQIRGAPRQNPHQPASQFAQTYLFQTGGRYGFGRRNNRGADNHMQRMEQQVQRAVEAAKLKPKNKQLVIEGSLGKISFSNAKTPKPLLNIKRQDSGDVRPNSPAHRRPSRGQNAAAADRKSALRDIENVYSTLMKLEDHERHMPPPLSEDSDPATIQAHMEWRQKLQALNQKLWRELKVMEPIILNSPIPHPFIAILSHPKGKKAIPRIFRHIDEQQRVTILTMLVVHLDQLDVIRLAVPTPDEPTPPRAVRDEVDLFAHAVMPPLFAYVNDAPLTIVVGLLGLVLDRATIPNLVRTKVGLSILTMFVSRAELVKESTPAETLGADWAHWTQLYNRLFDLAEPVLPHIFPGSVNDAAEDVYVWQFLAAMGVGASPEQQQRLVMGVKERVMETVMVSKALPAEMAAVRLGHVNLFMRAIGLDVELLG